MFEFCLIRNVDNHYSLFSFTYSQLIFPRTLISGLSEKNKTNTSSKVTDVGKKQTEFFCQFKK